jgi:O-antigen/teichoic acid export membrane protein
MLVTPGTSSSKGAGAAGETFGLKWLRQQLRSRLFGSMSIITIAMVTRLALQIVVFAIVAGAMGATQFGAFASVAALAGLFSSFSGWGADQLMLRRVGRRHEELPRAMATSLTFIAASAPPLILLAMIAVPLAVDDAIPWQLVLFVAIADIGMARISGVGGSCYQAVGRPMGTLKLSVGFGLARILAAVIWILASGRHDALSWSQYYFGISVLAAIVSLWRIRQDLGQPEWIVAWNEWRDGFHFALQTFAQASFGNTDKPVIAAFSDLSTAGLYAAASRIVNAAAIPVSALLYSAYVRFFQVGVNGTRSCARFAVRLLPVGIALGAVGTLATLVLAPLAPHVLGASYAGTERALILLAPLPILRAAYSLGLDVLVSTGRTGIRTVAQVAMPPVNILFCFLLVPSYGVAGAAIAALLSHAGLTVAAWIIVGVLVNRPEESAGGPVPLTTPAGDPHPRAAD